MNFKNVEEFYPTPIFLLEKIFTDFQWNGIKTVLEPSAGKGDMADYIKENACVKNVYRDYSYNVELDIDCVELDPELQATLKGKDYKVVHDDFLTFHTYKRYDLILMNPPFSIGLKFLLKAIDMQKNGGHIVCILNAETIRNQCTNERKALVQKLIDTEAEIQYMQSEFERAERKTSVEIAVVKINIEAPEYHSVIYEQMMKKVYAEGYMDNLTNIVENDNIKAAVSRYNHEVECGIKLINEYKALLPYIKDSIKDNGYSYPIIEMKVEKGDLEVNRYVKAVRRKYWTGLFADKMFTSNMTSNLVHEYLHKVDELAEYDFSYYNIKSIQIMIIDNLKKGITECIYQLFEDLTSTHTWYPECERNIHYYNGWCTNKAWIINSKVIIPMQCYSSIWKRMELNYTVLEKLRDIEKALNYLDQGFTNNVSLVAKIEEANKNQVTKDIKLKYFNVTFYKKGTCHLTFTCPELLKKFNIFGSQQKGWLPPSYGKKSYNEMSKEEKRVIDEFEGKDSYEKTVANTEYYLYSPDKCLPCLEVAS